MLEKIRHSGMLLLAAAMAVTLLISIEYRPKFKDVETTTESRLRSVLTKVEGAGDVKLLVNESSGGEIIGVCVLTDGADDVATVFRLQRAVQAALGIDNARIEVIKMEADGK